MKVTRKGISRDNTLGSDPTTNKYCIILFCKRICHTYLIKTEFDKFCSSKFPHFPCLLVTFFSRFYFVICHKDDIKVSFLNYIQ